MALQFPSGKKAYQKFNSGDGWELDEIESACNKEMYIGAAKWTAISVGAMAVLNMAANRFYPGLRSLYFLPRLIVGATVASGMADFGAGLASSSCIKRHLEAKHGHPIARLAGTNTMSAVTNGVQTTSPIPWTMRDNTEYGKGQKQMISPNPRDEIRDRAMEQLPKAH